MEEGVASLQRSPIYSAMADPNAAEMNALAGERSGDGECYQGMYTRVWCSFPRY